MSGTERTAPRFPGAVARAAGTTPFWYAGSFHSMLGPPPVTLRRSRKLHLPPRTIDSPSDQPVSNRRLLVLPIPSVVPPTAVANGSLDGGLTPEPSPAPKYMPTPSAAARTR